MTGHCISEFIVEGDQAVLTWLDDDGYSYIEVYAWGKFVPSSGAPTGASHLFLKQWMFLNNAENPEPSAPDEWWDLGSPEGQFTPSTKRGDFKAIRMVHHRSHGLRNNSRVPTPIRRLVITPAGGGDAYATKIDANPKSAPPQVVWNVVTGAQRENNP
jgi:hypothetical protein